MAGIIKQAVERKAQTVIELMLFTVLVVVLVLYLAPKYAEPVKSGLESVRKNIENTSDAGNKTIDAPLNLQYDYKKQNP